MRAAALKLAKPLLLIPLFIFTLAMLQRDASYSTKVNEQPKPIIIDAQKAAYIAKGQPYVGPYSDKPVECA